MKKQVFILLTALLVIGQSTFAYSFSATAPSGQTLYYNVVSSGNAQVTNQTGVISESYYVYPTGALTIPSSVTYNGTTYAVISIDVWAFNDCSGLTSVTIPNSVTSIGDCAFSGCSGLTSIVVESGNTVYDSRNNCNAIIEIATNTLVAGCNNTIIPNTVTSIGSYAFYDCIGLTSVAIPNSVTSIGDFAFSGCSGLTSVTIPNSVISIGEKVFSACSGLASIVVASGNTVYDSRNNCNAIIETATNTLVAGCNNTIIPNTVTSIGSYAFYYCTGLTSVTIPNSVTSIYQCAFSHCTGLTSITIPNSVTSISPNSFYGCSGLTSVTIPNSVTSIYHGAFSQCTGLTSITIPNSVTSIGNSAFSGCSGLTSVTIGNNVTSIDRNAFSGCTGLTSVIFNADSCTSVGSFYDGWAFDGCSNINTFTFGNNVKIIPPDLCFGMTGLTSMMIPNSVTSIGSQAFRGCTGLTSVTIGNSVTSIGVGAFNGCTGLTSVTIPNSVTSIYEHAFYYCTGLTSVTIPNSVTSIDEYAFYYCTGLTSVTIGNSVTSIGIYAFSQCTGLTSVMFNADRCASVGNSADNRAFDACPNINTFIFGNNVRIIPSYLCYEMTGLDSITIPASIETIGQSAFDNCSNLTEVNYTGSIAQWCGINFYDYASNPVIYSHSLSINGSPVTSINIPSGVTRINNYAFSTLSSLTSVMIPNSVYWIGERAFYSCTGLTSLTFLNPEPPTIVSDAFSGTLANILTVRVPCGSLTSYASILTDFIHFEEIYASFSVESEDETKGTVQVITMPSCTNHTAVLQAVPANGYRFDHWSTGSTENPYTLMVGEGMVITAYFTPDGSNRIDYVEDNGIEIRVTDGRIHVIYADETSALSEIRVYDLMGREVFHATHADETSALPGGVYLVKVGTLPAKKVVVIR